MKTARWLKGISQVTAAFLVGTGLVVSPVQAPTASANQSTGANSEIDYALTLTGAGGDGSYLKTANHPDLNRGGSSSQLVEAWVKPSAVSSQNVVFAKDLSFVIRASTNGWNLLTGSGSGWGSEAFGGAVKIGVWQHVGLVVEQNQQRLYIDGSLVATVNNAHGDSTRAFSVGGYEDGNAPFAGEIDEVKIWVNKNQNDIPVTMQTRASGADANLRAYWDFNEDSGTTVYNRKSDSVQNLELQGSGTRTDVKTVSTIAPNDRVVSFPRTYLPGVGGWTVPEGISAVRLLMVGGGGAGGGSIGGGGGAGELLRSNSFPVPSDTYSVVVGTGGNPTANGTSRAGGAGSNSQFGSLIAYGGGGGGADNNFQVTPSQPNDGNTFGGGGGGDFFSGNPGTVTARTVANVTRSANAGGDGTRAGGAEAASGGGGGADGAGGSAIANSTLNIGGNVTTIYGYGGNGGLGHTSNILGSDKVFGCGGGGGFNGAYGWSTGAPGNGGCGVGSPGNGGLRDTTNDGVPNQTNGFDGAPNTGSGGGGASNHLAGGAGGSGIVIVRYTLPASPSPSFGSVTSITGGFTVPVSNYLTNSNDSTYTWDVSSTVGTVSLDSQGLITVTGLGSEVSATVTVAVSRTGYVSSSGTASGTSLPVYPACAPTASSSIPGYTVLTFASTGICNWEAPAGVTEVDLLVVGGGGGGGTPEGRDIRGGSGGAGGVFKATEVDIPANVLVRVGAAGGAQQFGSDSAFGSLLVGGGGFGPEPYTSTHPGNGRGGSNYVSGGSGGGGNHNVGAYLTKTQAGSGGAIGNVSFNGASYTGVAGAAGTNGGSDWSQPGTGGQIALSDRTSDITGASVVYAFGGTNLATSAPQGYGSGGHSRFGWTSGVQGVVIVKYANSACTPTEGTYVGNGTNGTLNTNYRTYTFSPGSSCPWTVPVGITEFEALLVGGGGGGGAAFDSGGAGGGGGGQVVVTDLDLNGVSSVTVQVGAGGAGGVGSAGATRETNGSAGGNSTIFNSGASVASALGGDGGARSRGDYLVPARSLSAGGAAATANTPARGGAFGGNSQSATWGMGGGGGGSFGAGGNGRSNTTTPAQGGAGTAVSISGSSQTFGRGGNGSAYWETPGNGANAVSATGNGGGGARASSSGSDQRSGGAGGAGLIILRAEVAPASYTVNFDANTGTGTMASRTEANNVAFTLPANSFEKSGFTFQGWNTKADGTGTSYEAGDSVTLTGTSTAVTFYPEWRAALSIATPSSGLSATFGQIYNLALVAAGGSGGYTYSVASGTLPAGLTLSSSTGAISGTPTAAGSAAIQISAQDSESTSVTTSSFTIVVSAAVVGSVGTPTVTAPAGAAKRIDVGWTAVPNADFYSVKVYNQAGTTLLATISSIVGVSSSVTTSNYASIADDTNYSITVTAIASGNYASGPESSQVSIKTNYSRIVTFNFSQATSGATPTSLTYVEGDTLPTLPTPARTGYTFDGWYREANFATLVGAAGSSFTPHATYTAFAKWNANTYTLTFDSNGGSAVNAITFLAESSVAIPAQPTRAGFRFVGWSTSETANQGDLSNRVFAWPYSPGVADRTLFAAWADDYSLNFAGNSGVSARIGSSAGPELNVVPRDFSFTWEAWIRPTNTGREWSSIVDNLNPVNAGRATVFIRDTGTGPLLNSFYRSDSGSQNSVQSSVNSIRYNEWQHIAISYTRTGGAEGSCVGTGTLETRIYIDGVLVRNFSDPSFSGCLVNRGLTLGNIGTSQQFNGSIDQVKIWDGALSQAEIQNSMASFGLGTVDNNLRAHYSFDDLAASPASGQKLKNFASNSGISDLALFAATASNVAANTSRTLNSFDISFDGNDELSGSVATISGTRPFSSNTLPTKGNLLRAGYTFTDWDTLSAGGGTSYAESASYVTLYGDRTFFAQWEANGLAVTWNPKGGSAVTGTTVATNAQLTAPTAPTRTGYTFAGWSATDGGAAVSLPYTHGQTDAFTMFALWTANTLTLSFDSNGGSAVTAISFLADATASRPTSPNKTGFRFAGWSTSETSDQGDLAQRVLTWPYLPGVTDRTLYAIWVDDYSLGLAGNARVSARVGTSASPVSVVPNNSSYTWEAWIYPTGVSGTGPTKFGTILDNLDDGNNYGRSWLYLIDQAGGPRIQVGYYAAGTPEEGTSLATSGNTISYNQWQHVAVSFERTGGAAGSCAGTGSLIMRIYIDGVLSATGQDSSFSRCLSSIGLGIGDNWDDPNQQFKGRIDQVKVWDGALSQAQIQNSRQSFGAGTVVNNLRAHYSFDDLGSAPASGNAVDNLVTHNGEFDLTLFASTPADVAANTSRQLNSFDLTFDENGADSGSVATISDTRPYVTSTIAAQGDLLKAGYTFAGWDTSANGSGTSYAAGDSYLALYGSQTFYAQWDADDLAVTWDVKGGTTIASTTVKTNATLAAPANPTRTGYTFDGWSATDGGSEVTFPYTHGKTAGFTMFARWIADVYTVTYNYNSSDGGESRATDTFTVGTTALTLPVPNRTGYGFGGWFVSPTFAGQAVSSTYTPTASVTLHAQWTGQTYTILYEYNGADGSAATDSDSYTSGLTAITPPTPTKTGHTFGGWFESAAFAGSPVGASYTTSQNRTLYAKWTAIQYSVTYNPDIVVSGVTYSGSGDVPTAGSSYTIGQSVPVLPNAQATPLTRLGYTFLGWVTNQDGTGTALNSGDSVTMGSANINFYPKWSANTYSITYNLNGGTGSLSGAPTSYTVGGNSVSLPSSGFTKTGFNFLGWTKVQGGTTPISNTFSTFTDVTLTAIWELKTITYTFDDGIANSANIQNWPSNSSASFGSSITLPNLTGVTTTVGSDSYLFFGWAYQGSTYESGDSFTLGEAAPTFTAQWIQLFDVRYGFAGGTHSVAGDQEAACLANNPQLCTNSQVITLRSNPSRPGYTFDGWKVQAKATVKAGGAQHTLRNDEYLFYAQWQAIDYIFSFNSVGGSNNFADVTKNIGQVVTLPNPGQKPGHSFAGWSANGSQSFLSASAPFVVSTASVAFDAVWVPDVYTVVFDWQGALGAPQPNASYTFGSGNMTLPAVGGRTKDGFNFAGWSTAPSGTVLTDFQPTSNDVLYAIWTDGSYALTFAPKGGSMANTSASVPRGNSIQMPTPVREGFVFTGWFDQATGGSLVAAGGATFSPNASRTLHARWVQRSLFGVDLAALETSQEYTASSVNEIDTTITHNPTGTSARIQIPAGALPSGTKVNVRFFKDTDRQEQVISNQNSYIFSILISWMLGSGDSATVPNTDPDKPLVVTLNNSDIKAGAMIYQVVGDQITELGRATQNGTVTVELYEDPEVVVALTPPAIPASMVVTPGDTEAIVTWTAPLADGGLPTTSYTVTASPGGQTCTWTSGPLTCTITGLTNGLNYTFSVVANNRLGSSIAASNSATPTQPAANNSGSLGPTGPAAGIKPVTGQTRVWTKRISANQVKVYIKFPEMGSNYQINLQKNDGDFRRVMSKTINTTSDTDLLLVGTSYYLVRTIDLPGEGRYRIEVTVDGERMLLNGKDRPKVFNYR